MIMPRKSLKSSGGNNDSIKKIFVILKELARWHLIDFVKLEKNHDPGKKMSVHSTGSNNVFVISIKLNMTSNHKAKMNWVSVLGRFCLFSTRFVALFDIVYGIFCLLQTVPGGWWRAQNSAGQEGFIPADFIEVFCLILLS